MSADSHSQNSGRVGPGQPLGVSEELIREVVHTFYGKVRLDPEIGPIFNSVIGDEWDAHLAKLCDFWSSVLLMTGRFKGQPMMAHVRIPDITEAHFVRWLQLFQETVTDICPPPVAALFMDKAQMIARSLQLGIATSRGEFPFRTPDA